MTDTLAFAPSDSQSEYAFPPGEADDVAQSEQRNQSIQQSFDSQRMQRGFIQNIGKQIAQIRQHEAQK
jgi:hypothetical protein